MAKSCTRFKIPNTPDDILNSNIDWVNVGILPNNPVFTSTTNSSGMFRQNSLIYSNNTGFDFTFSDIFTVAFWAKATMGQITDTVYPNKFIVQLDASNILSVDIPTTITLTNWNYFDVTRSTDGNIYLRINGTTVGTFTSNTTPLNFLSNSYIYVGNNNRFSTGYEMSADDIFIIDTALHDADYTVLPTSYIDVDTFNYCLFIKVSTGEVWGYQKES